ncbi:YpmA family protein [Bacillus seohaeanensis]|uniref:YpmA family protein n=1 Tax=Bacillus seohaeanensis TaxID=284580 RepID=A0ABW5RRH4_9BACI
MESKIEVLSTLRISYSDDLYKMVDVLNKTLKKDDLMFGLALDPEDQEQAIFTIYRT